MVDGEIENGLKKEKEERREGRRERGELEEKMEGLDQGGRKAKTEGKRGKPRREEETA